MVSINCTHRNGTFQSRCLFFDCSSEIVYMRGAEHWNRLPGEVVESAVQKLSGHNPEQHALGGPCLSKEVGQDDLQ